MLFCRLEAEERLSNAQLRQVTCMYPMDPKRQHELDYLAREIANQQELKRENREQSEALARQMADALRIEEERERRELSSLTSAQKEEHQALERAVEKALSAKSQAASADRRLGAAARKCRRRALIAAAIPVPFITIYVLAKTFGAPGGYSLVDWLIFLGCMAIFIFRLMRSLTAKHAVADEAAKLRREASRLRGKAARIVALGRFQMTSKLSRRADKLGLSSRLQSR